MTNTEKIIGIILWVFCFMVSPAMLVFMLVAPVLVGFWRKLLIVVEFPNMAWKEYDKRLKQKKNMNRNRPNNDIGLN